MKCKYEALAEHEYEGIDSFNIISTLLLNFTGLCYKKGSRILGAFQLTELSIKVSVEEVIDHLFL